MTISPTRNVGLAEAVVDLDAVAHNTAMFTERTSATVMAVVKADAFGHGAVPVAMAALSAGASWLGVATNAEALELRQNGISAPILSWIHGHDEDFRDALRLDVDLSASSIHHLTRIATAATSVGATAQVHLKVDTGLRRSGAQPDEWLNLVHHARNLEREGTLHVRGIWTHLISGVGSWAETTFAQRDLFDAAVEVAREAGLRPELRHLANSAAALHTPETEYEMLRPGIGLYGVEPDPSYVYGLRPAMTLRAHLNLVKRVPANTGVSYEHNYVTSKPSTLGLVPLGYADGVPRSAMAIGQVWFAGSRYPIAGSVTMDQFVADLGATPARIGDEIVLFGTGEHGEPTVAEWAAWTKTSPHEILTGIGQRVPRRYVGKFAEVAAIQG